MVGCEGRRTVRLHPLMWVKARGGGGGGGGGGGSQGSVCWEHQIWDYFGWILHLHVCIQYLFKSSNLIQEIEFREFTGRSN